MSDTTQNTTPEGNPGEQNGQQNNQQQERTFSQDEVNDIVQKRLAKERDRMAKLFQEEKQISELDEREQKLLKRELRADAIEELGRRGLPTRLSELFDYSSKENCENSMKEVIEIFSDSLGEIRRAAARQSTPKDGHEVSSRSSDPLRSAFSLR